MLAFAALSLWVAAAEARSVLGAFDQPINVAEMQRLDTNPMIVPGRYRMAVFDGEALSHSINTGAPLVLNLFSDMELRANIESSRKLDSGSLFYSGSLASGGHFTMLLRHSGIVRGEFHTSLGTYSLKTQGENRDLVLIAQHDFSGVRQCGVDGIGAESLAPQDKQFDALPGKIGSHPAAPPIGQKQGNSETVDVLAVYTQRAEDYEGGPEEVRATIENDIAKMNQVLENSNLRHRQIRLAAAEKVDYVQDEKGLGRDILNLERTSAHNYNDNDYSALDEVHELREKHQADLVNLFVRDPIGACGKAAVYRLSEEQWNDKHRCPGTSNTATCVNQERVREWKRRSYTVSSIACSNGYTFVHELGHSLGLLHHRGDYTWTGSSVVHGSYPLRPNGFGYVSPDSSQQICQYTVMAVNPCRAEDGIKHGIQEPYFSNPDVLFPPPQNSPYYDPATFEDTPMGVPGDEYTIDLTGPANAAQAIDDVWDIVASLSDLDDAAAPPIRNACQHGDISADALSSALETSIEVPPGGVHEVDLSWPVPENCSNVAPWALTNDSFIDTSVEKLGEGEFRLSIRTMADNAASSCEGMNGSVRVGVTGVTGVAETRITVSQPSSNALCRGVSEAPEDSTSLDLSSRNQSGSLSLLAGMFSRFTELGSLDLSDNKLGHIERRIFNGLDRLTELDLSRNLLTAVPDYAFAELSGLETLSLNDNRIGGEVTQLSFWGAQQLKVLNLSRNALTGLADGAFEENKNLESLWLQSNDIARIHADALDGLSELKLLSLSRNELTELPEDTFVDLTSLEHLWLYGNRLSDLPAGLFSGLTELRTLSLSGNQLTSVPDGVFSDLTALEQLWLLDNGITAIASGTLEGLSSVRSLSLSGNDLTSLPNRAFSEAQSLEALWLYGNGISDIAPNAFDGLANLRYLDISNNPLSAPLPASVCSFLRGVDTLRAEGIDMGAVCPQ